MIEQQASQQILKRHERAPSAFAFMARAFPPSPGLAQDGAVPDIVQRWEGLRIETDHLAAFRRASGLFEENGVSILYPHVLGFRLQMALLTHRAYPLPIWNALQIRNRLVRHRRFRPGERRDRIFAKHLDDSIRNLGVEVLRSPVASPKANSICERVIGTARRECLDWLIPLSEAHLRAILKCWVTHYNGGRPHGALGLGVPDPPENQEVIPKLETRHCVAAGTLVLVKSVLGGLHHEYSARKGESSA